SRGWLLLPLPALVVWLSTIGYGCLTDWVDIDANGLRIGEAARCFATLVLTSVPLSLLMFVMLRHAAPLRPTPVALIGSLAAAAAPRTLNGFDLKDSLIPPDQILPGGPGRDGIPAIDAPKFVPASAANLAAADRVLGLVRNGAVKAYPVRILNWHEIVNDRFGDEPIAVTYC